MKTIHDDLPFFEQLMTMLEQQLGYDSEIVLHDLTGDYNHTIVSIRNSHITQRKVGDCGTNLGLEVLKGKVGDQYNYITHTKDGKILRSSSMYIRNNEGEVVGALCINTDITDYLKVVEKLKRLTHNHEETVDEFFNGNVGDLLDDLISKAIETVNTPVSSMSRKEKLLVLNSWKKREHFRFPSLENMSVRF